MLMMMTPTNTMTKSKQSIDAFIYLSRTDRYTSTRWRVSM